MYEPLNPGLFNALVRRFHFVDIANQGESYSPSYPGEYYRVNCPYCSDTTKRLWINHKFNTAETDSRDDRIYLAHCFNDGCIDCREVQLELVDMIYPFGYRRRKQLEAQNPVPVSRQGQPSRPTFDTPAQLPVCFPLADSSSHNARRYLVDRGFDTLELTNRWGVGYCLIAPNASPRLYDRIVIPIYEFKKSIVTAGLDSPRTSEQYLAGWIARKVGGGGSGPKYLNMKGLRKHELLYGLPRAVEGEGPVVVVEGPTDVWRLGGNAVATLGKSIAFSQCQKLVRYFRRRPIIVMYDAGASGEAESVAHTIRASRQRFGDTTPVFTSPPPAGAEDVGESCREVAWATVRAACGTVGA